MLEYFGTILASTSSPHFENLFWMSVLRMYVPHCLLCDEDVITQLDHTALILIFKKGCVLFESENNSVKPNNPHINERFVMFVQF